MGKIKDKNLILDKIRDAANKYDTLVTRSYLYVFDSRYIEVAFRRKDFMHLTGVDIRIKAEQFFRNVKKGTIRPNQIYFSQRHPYDLCKKKIQYLESLPELTCSNVSIEENIFTKTFTYKFGITDMSFTLCLSKDADDSGAEKSNYYIARSLRVGNEVSRARNVYNVSCILSKPNTARLYTEIQYSDVNISLADLPDSIKDIIDESLLV